jgi:dipeptidyl aminopeptidase/acylaminoacyl peptidase
VSSVLISFIITLLALLFGGLAVEHIGSAAMVYAPNAGHPPDPAKDPPAALVPGAPFSTRPLRVEVGPPTASLSGLLVEPSGAKASALRGTVFVLHGIRDCKESMLAWGERLAAAGYRAVLMDARGHGRSSGDFLTYGVVEARDLSQVLDALVAQGLASGKVGVMGMSYGAATSIEWAGVDPRVAAVVAVAPFASLRAVVPTYARRFLPGLGALLPDFLLARTVTRAGLTASFDPDAASPLDAITRTRAPVLLVHGQDDTNIPPEHSVAMHERAADHSDLLLLPGEDHATVTADRTGTLWPRALALFARVL